MLEVNSVIGGITPPTIFGKSPGMARTSIHVGGVAFNINDDASAPLDNIKLTLNGVVYSNGSPGCHHHAVGACPASAAISRSQNLAPNVFYVGSIQASDDLGATSSIQFPLRRFLAKRPFRWKPEDFNYSNNPLRRGTVVNSSIPA